MPERPIAAYFTLFNEIGIIAQLSRAMFEARLPSAMLVSHFAVLNHLIRVQDGRTPLELARAFQVPKTTMTHTLSVLGVAGLVSQRPNARDGRSKRIWITEAGRTFRDTAIGALAPDLERLQEHFSPSEVERLLPQLTALRTILDAMRDETNLVDRDVV
jgi:DNA-binding MarR family transcriptional regulator